MRSTDVVMISLFSLYNLPDEKVPMHPEDYAALLAWVRAKEEGG